MSTIETGDPWPRMRGVVTAVVSSLRSGSFIEEALESLCVQLGASSAWSTLETKGGGRIHRSRTTSLAVAPAVLAEHVTQVLDQVQTEHRTVAGSVPYAPKGSFIGVPLWSHPTGDHRSLIGVMYLEFPNDEGTQGPVLEFVECVGSMLGGAIVQQCLIEAKEEALLVERAKHPNERYFRLDELLAFDNMSAVREELGAAIAGNASIMLLGESGTGKTQVATAFARASNREPIVRATLGHSDDLNTITSELFGHERGAFSGAVGKRRGLVEYADGGTLILDEVLALPPHAQQVLLDFTQFGSYRPLGYEGGEPKRADVRLISLTNGDVAKAIEDERFREDLYYRLATVPVVLPPLRDRRDDIPTIAVSYLNSTDVQASWELDSEVTELLTSPRLDWPGNIRELEAVMERARNRVRARGSGEPVIEADHLDVSLGSASQALTSASAGQPFPNGVRDKWEQLAGQKAKLEALEKEIIEEALAVCGGVVLRTARELSVSRTGLMSRMTTLEIDPEKFKAKRG
ncbi:MAG: sigma-54-dependent Fis family transcriptional regulator [Deltaproteobacteria bacterium]|nr:sigma-54-dependent Fis family transcriptional regulator [Deltaproteobacteria bacterium]